MKRLVLIFALLCTISFAKGDNWTGTGFALKGNYVITNYHVVDGAYSLQVRGVKGDFTKMYNAVVVATDIKNDMAIIRIDDDRFKGFGNIPYAIKSESSEVGEGVVAMGYPLLSTMGEEIKATDGMISSLSGYLGDITAYQVTTPIQPGNSGGPLFDSNGNVVGIINAKHSQADNAGYAIKSPYMRLFIQNSIGSSAIPTNSKMVGWSRPNIIKAIKPFVFIIYASTEGGGWIKVSDTGTLHNANVYVDGTYIGRTPITSNRIANGEHTVSIVKPHYRPIVERVYIRNGEVTNLNPTLQPILGKLNITSSPADADVLIDGEMVGQTPLTQDLIIGDHKIIIRKDGYRSIERKITISEGHTKDIEIELNAITSISLSVEKDNDSNIYINDKLVGKGSWSGELVAGIYTFEARKAGHTTSSITKTINIDTREQHFVIPTPQPIFGRLNITSSPTGADVHIDGRYADQTPFSQKLIIGYHDITISKNKYRSDNRRIYISEGQTKNVTVKLKRYDYWQSFNLGVAADVAVINYGNGAEFGLGCGITWRLFDYNSLFIPTIGVRYMHGFQNSYAIGFPLAVNCNFWGALAGFDISLYTGFGIEPIYINKKGIYDSKWSWGAIITPIGVGCRHHDVCITVSANGKTIDFVIVGIRYTYFF